ncbi:hypothetical protein ALNOE001_17520 [Candidatus Methanobinarius endosymbioticus]|uniref:DUF11 domain-containing protein n=1 Tax=Candidatus Methanobinarius endosymbioticus TaxID=2006182 RepID=A0A366M927_9EURY|nr:hypothetical protein ALNOE001_17520 [Candidatus Methanobinarius endosymbioticus]
MEKSIWRNGTDYINLTITKVANVTKNPSYGQLINYTITVTNHGPDDVTGVVVNELLSGSLVYVDDSSGGLYDPGTGVWSIGSLNNGDSVTLVITVRVNGTGLIVNDVNVTSEIRKILTTILTTLILLKTLQLNQIILIPLIQVLVLLVKFLMMVNP